MKAVLPDISVSETSPHLSPLDWVGMQGIDLAVVLDEPGYRKEIHANADVQVDLPATQVKGIHMSRLYRLLDGLSDQRSLTPSLLYQTLLAMVDSHRDCSSRQARLRLSFNLLARRPALVTADLAGRKSYPVKIDAILNAHAFSLRAQVTVGYSSTCPCSAALARQLIEQQFRKVFAGQPSIALNDAADWLQAHASLATPHSQRSEALVAVAIPLEAPHLNLMALIDGVEHAVATPVQTAVKRADEQEFAALNGQNLMFVEDAARRIQSALNAHYSEPTVYVRHLESLHPHNAVAWSSSVPAERHA